MATKHPILVHHLQIILVRTVQEGSIYAETLLRSEIDRIRIRRPKKGQDPDPI